MGRVLQIRVLAQTPRPEDVVDNWPRLAHLAWEGDVSPAGGRARGVMQFVEDLYGKIRFAVADDVREALEPHLKKADGLRRDIEKALGDWDATTANRLSNELETQLDEIEPLAPEAPFVVSKRKNKN